MISWDQYVLDWFHEQARSPNQLFFQIGLRVAKGLAVAAVIAVAWVIVNWYKIFQSVIVNNPPSNRSPTSSASVTLTSPQYPP